MKELKRKQADYPFDDYWLYVVFHKKEGRRMANLILQSNTNSRTTIAYARYLMSVSLGRFLSRDEHVDHINGDKSDDRIANLQLLTPVENIKKCVVEQGKSAISVELVCPICGITFSRPKNRSYSKTHLGKDICCSKDCGRKQARLKLLNNTTTSLSHSDIGKIKELHEDGLSSYKISELTGFARNTIMKHW